MANKNNRSWGSYADYVIWGGESGGPVDDFFNGVGEDPQWVGANVFGGTEQHNVTYRKNVALRCRCSVPVAEWQSRCISRRNYFACGPNFIWHLDGYDKLKPFGLCISAAIDQFLRKIIWLNVYKTNNDPRIIAGYFIEAVQEVCGCPRVVHGDWIGLSKV